MLVKYDAPQTVAGLLGHAYNLDEPMPPLNSRPMILGFVITFMLLSWTCACLRLYVRLVVQYAPGWDDLFLGLYLLVSTAGSVTVCILPNYGLGQHFLLLPITTMEGYLKGFYVANFAYMMATALVKVSLLFQYMRVMEGIMIRRLCVVMIVLVSLWGLAFTIIAWVPCDPVSAFWDLTITDAKCWGFDSPDPDVFVGTYIGQTVVNMIFDIIIFLIPIPLYFRKDLTNKSRLALSGLFLIGSVVVLVSIFRLQGLLEHRATTYPTFDPTWYAPSVIVLGCIEVDIASICASAPVFWPVLSAQVTKIFVTQEIEIIREDRSPGDAFEMHRTWSGSSMQETPGSGHSHHGSEVGLSSDNVTEKRTVIAKIRHYGDRYVKEQVDPFSKLSSTEAGVASGTASLIRAGEPRRDHSEK